jgi:hypothetical protein
MSVTPGSEVERFFYRSSTASNRHRNRVSAYYVERIRGSKVVARIEALGLVPSSIGDEQLAIQRLRRNLIVAGSWQQTSSGHHVRQRVAQAKVATTQKVAPQNS